MQLEPEVVILRNHTIQYESLHLSLYYKIDFCQRNAFAICLLHCDFQYMVNIAIYDHYMNNILQIVIGIMFSHRIHLK